MLCATYLRKSNKTFLCQTKRGKAVHSLCGRELKRDGEGSGEGERRTQSESRSRTFVSLRGGERRRKPSVQGRERALALGGLLGEQKAGSKAMEAQMEGNFCPLKNDFLIIFFCFLFSVCGWSGRGALAHGPGDVPGGSLPASALQAARAAKRRCVCVRFGTDNSQRTTCTQGRRCLTGVFPFSPVTCTHSTQNPLGKDQRLAPAAAAITLHL